MHNNRMPSDSLMREYDQFALETGARHEEAFSLADRLLSAARALLRGPITNEPRAMVLSLLFGRVLSAAHGSIVMVRMGREVEADTLMRSALEAGFRLAAIGRNPERLADYIAEGSAVRQRAMKDLRAHLTDGAPTHESVTDASIAAAIRDIDGERQRLLQHAGKTRLRKREVYEWARDADQISLFRMKYLLLSEAAHHSARNLERALVLRDNGSVEALRFVPDKCHDVPTAIADVMVVLAHAVHAFGSSTGRDTAAFSAEYVAVQTIHAKAAADFKGPPQKPRKRKD